MPCFKGPVNILAEREIAVQAGAVEYGIIRAQDPLAPLPRFSHLIYTDLRGHQFWIKIGKNLAIGSTKCSLGTGLDKIAVTPTRLNNKHFHCTCYHKQHIALIGFTA